MNFSELSDMLYGQESYLKEFATAAISSFSEFSENYKKHLLSRDEEKFRKAGHKIKPVAQMLGLNQIIDEYEHAKTLLWDEKSDEELEQSADEIQQICSKVISELKEEI